MFVARFGTVGLILSLSGVFTFFSLFSHKNLLTAIKKDGVSGSYNLTDGRNESAVSCNNRTLEAGDYELTNGTLFVKKLNMTLDESSYHFVNDSVTICEPRVIVNDCEVDRPLVSCYTANGVILSFVTLLAILLVFWYVLDYKNLLYWSLCIIAVLLLVTFWIFGIRNSMKDDKASADNVMYTLPTVIHIMLLTSVSWMSILSSPVFFTASGGSTLKKVNGRIRIADWSFFNRRIFVLILFISSFIILANVLIVKPYVGDTDPFCSDVQTRPSVGYFGGLVLVFAIFNFQGFALSVHEYRRLAKHPGFQYYPSGVGKSYSAFMYLSMLLYLTWAIGALASVPDYEGLWNVFMVLTTLESIFIFCLIHYLDMQSYIRRAIAQAVKKDPRASQKTNSVKSMENIFDKCNEAMKEKKNKIVKSKHSPPIGLAQNTIYCAVLIPQSEVNGIYIEEV